MTKHIVSAIALVLLLCALCQSKDPQFPPLKDVSADKTPTAKVTGKAPQFPDEWSHDKDHDVATNGLCPCSQSGNCACTPGNQCGCIDEGKYRWIPVKGEKQTALYKGNTQVGNLCFDEPGTPFYACAGGVWLKSTCPVSKPMMSAYVKPQFTPLDQSFVQPSQSATKTQQIQYYSAPTYTYTGSSRGFSGMSAGSCSSGG